MTQTDQIGGPAGALPPDRLGTALALIGFALDLVVGLIFFVAAGLIAPLYGIIVLDIGWIVLFVIAIRMWKKRQRRLIILLPLVTFGYWSAIVTIGERLFGWEA